MYTYLVFCFFFLVYTTLFSFASTFWDSLGSDFAICIGLVKRLQIFSPPDSAYILGIYCMLTLFSLFSLIVFFFGFCFNFLYMFRKLCAVWISTICKGYIVCIEKQKKKKLKNINMEIKNADCISSLALGVIYYWISICGTLVFYIVVIHGKIFVISLHSSSLKLLQPPLIPSYDNVGNIFAKIHDVGKHNSVIII